MCWHFRPKGRPNPHGSRQRLKDAAEREKAWMWFARSGMMHALLGPVDPPIGNPEGKKGRRWGKRKLARDR
jgi:hypothetical protein